MTVAAEVPPPDPQPPDPAGPGGDGPLLVVPWRDPEVERTGVGAHSPDVERHWLPLLGPTATVLLRRVVHGLLGSPGGYVVDRHDLAVAIGLGGAGGRNAPLPRALRRCMRYGVARRVKDRSGPGGAPAVAFRLMLPAAPAWGPSPVVPPGPEGPAGALDAQWRRAVTLALEVGPLVPDRASLERYLHQVGTHPSLAGPAARAVHDLRAQPFS